MHQAGAECGGESVKGKQEGGFCGDGTVLCLDPGGGYMNLHM